MSLAAFLQDKCFSFSCLKHTKVAFCINESHVWCYTTQWTRLLSCRMCAVLNIYHIDVCFIYETQIYRMSRYAGGCQRFRKRVYFYSVKCPKHGWSWSLFFKKHQTKHLKTWVLNLCNFLLFFYQLIKKIICSCSR